MADAWTHPSAASNGQSLYAGYVKEEALPKESSFSFSLVDSSLHVVEFLCWVLKSSRYHQVIS